LPQWRTTVFTVVVLAQMAHVQAIRSERESLFTIELGSNPSLLGAVGLAVLLQVGLVYWPPAQALFGTVSLSAVDLALAVALSSAVFWAVELEKWLGRRRRAAPEATLPVLGWLGGGADHVGSAEAPALPRADGVTTRPTLAGVSRAGTRAAPVMAAHGAGRPGGAAPAPRIGDTHDADQADADESGPEREVPR
jgi:hypothetical protein